MLLAAVRPTLPAHLQYYYGTTTALLPAVRLTLPAHLEYCYGTTTALLPAVRPTTPVVNQVFIASLVGSDPYLKVGGRRGAGGLSYPTKYQPQSNPGVGAQREAGD